MKKIAIIGAGNVGSHVASALIHQGESYQIQLVDLNQKFETAQVLDLRDMTPLFPNSQILEADLPEIVDADFVIITAGAPQKPGETRLDLVEKNKNILNTIAEQMGAISNHTEIILVANPVDILTQVAHHIWPANNVYGSGTYLDTMRLRWHLTEVQNLPVSEVGGFVLGEHGDSSFVQWSGIPNNLTDAQKSQIEESVRREAYEIIEGKGSTYFGIGATVAQIIYKRIKGQSEIIPLSRYCEVSDMAFSILCDVANLELVPMTLSESEIACMDNSIACLKQV